MIVHNFDETPKDIIKREFKKQEIRLFQDQKLFILSYDGNILYPRFGIDIEGFKTDKDEYIFRRGELIKNEMVGGKRKDELEYSLVILENNKTTSLPFPSGLELDTVDIIGYYNNRICMLGKRGGKYLIFPNYNKSLINSETPRLLQ